MPRRRLREYVAPDPGTTGDTSDDPPHILSIGPFSLGVIVHSSMTVRHFFGTLKSLERMVASMVVPIPVSAPAALRDPRAAIIVGSTPETDSK